MSWWLIVLLLVVVLVLAWYLSTTAGRLDRLHRRIETSTFALDAQLLRRSSVAIELSVADVLDPASSELIAETAHDARQSIDGDVQERIAAESALSEVLMQALDDVDEVNLLREDPLAADLLDELSSAIRRVELCRRFLNDAVLACSQIHEHRLVRWFRLAGHTPVPTTWEMDDRQPQGLGIIES
jgi:cell division protein FtsB